MIRRIVIDNFCTCNMYFMQHIYKLKWNRV